MDFQPTKEQKMIVDSVIQFVKNESGVARFRSLRSTDQGWEQETWKKMADYGWLGLAISEEYEGLGGSFVDLALVLEQLGMGLVPEPFIPSVVLCGSLLERLGSPDQRNELLTPMIDGDISLALAYAEKQSRYCLHDCQTRAMQTPNGWTISGEKAWVLNGHAADHILVVARTDGEQLDSAGLSIFCVASDTPGLERTLVNTMDGQKAAFIEFRDVAVNQAALVGEQGQALETLEWVIDRGAAAACAEGQGHLQQMLAATMEHLKQREQFGVKIGSFQALQHKAADMFAETELCRGMMLLAALNVDTAEPEQRRKEISAAKAHLTSSGWFVQENCIQLHGGIGVTDEQDVGLYFKRLRVLQGLFGDEDYHLDRFQSLPSFAD